MNAMILHEFFFDGWAKRAGRQKRYGANMANRLLAIAVGLAGLIGSTAAAEEFRKLSGTQIRAQFTGKQFTDEVHWGEVYEPNGRLVSQSMGRKRVGTWRVQMNQLCIELGKDDPGDCYEVWMAEKKVQLRTPGSSDASMEGVLETPPKGH